MLIAASSLVFRHPGAERDALDTLSFSLEQGRLCCLAGVNGSGKSTLLAVLAGLFPPASGTLRVAGRELPQEAARLRGKVALVPQDPDRYILGSLVEEDLLLGIDALDDAARQRALSLADAFGLGGFLQQPVHTLSYGQKRKLCLASALAGGPELLLLDEPFSGLDHPASLAMRDILRRNKAAGLTQIVVTHDLDLVADLADTFLLLREGRLECLGDKDAVFPRLLAAGVRPPCSWFSGGSAPVWAGTC